MYIPKPFGGDVTLFAAHMAPCRPSTLVISGDDLSSGLGLLAQAMGAAAELPSVTRVIVAGRVEWSSDVEGGIVRRELPMGWSECPNPDVVETVTAALDAVGAERVRLMQLMMCAASWDIDSLNSFLAQHRRFGHTPIQAFDKDVDSEDA